jgi:MFS family permease
MRTEHFGPNERVSGNGGTVRSNLAHITCADFLVRTAYQMGKTPLLPIFAASLGAGQMLTGTIVSVSTLTGFLLKPLFGFLSDRQGRRVWMLVAVAVFALVPFVYGWVETAGQLFALRLVHGLATAKRRLSGRPAVRCLAVDGDGPARCFHPDRGDQLSGLRAGAVARPQQFRPRATAIVGGQ